MKIKKLEILGFKSFIDKVFLTFPPGVTTIVGPNGSGKSNLVDAIKWTLGEQSIKSLRGKSMEDVIFNGSHDKRPLGMAEVTLTFTDLKGNGNAPTQFIDLGEITVRRRIFRSGESEYYLNKTRCRLKDIQDLLMGTGIGSKSYSIIAQGQIGSIITAHPRDRRYLLEEAAGITKYKAKKTEALRKMDLTQQNLLRIGDIIVEVKRQMESLSRQARRAEQYKEFKVELKRLELIHAARRYNDMSDKTDSQRKILTDKEGVETKNLTIISALDAKIEEKKRLSLKKEDELSDKQRRFYTNESDIKTLEQSISHLNERIRATTDRNGLFLSEIEGLETLIDETTGKIETLTSRIASAESESDSLKEDLETNEKELSLFYKDVEELTERWEELKEQQLYEASRLARMRNNISSGMKWIEHSEKDIKRKEEELDSLNKESIEVEELLKTAEQEETELKEEREKTSYLLDETRNRVNELMDEEARLYGEHEDVRHFRTEVASRLTALEEMEKGFEGINEGVRSVMEGGRQGIRGLFADFIETDEEYEKALEGYLGEALSAVVVEDTSEVRRHIARLKENGAGRAVFMPIDSVNETENHPPISATGALGRLKDFVDIKGDEGRAFASPLEDAYLVSDLDDALTIRDTEKPPFPLVTLDGEVLTPNGLIYGGRVEGGYSILKNRRERDSLVIKIGEIDGEISSINERLDRSKNNLSSGQKSLKDTENRITSIKIKATEIEKRRDASLKDKERVDRALKRITSEIESEKNEIERLKSEIESSLSLLSRAEESEEGREGESSKLKTTLVEKQREVKSVEQRGMEQKVALQKAIDLKEHLKETKEEYVRQIERSKEDIENKKRAKTIGEGEVEGFLEEISNTENRLSVSITEAKKLENDLRDANATMNEIVVSENKLVEEKKEIQLKLSSIREELQENRAQIRELEWERENLTSRIQEDYQVDIGETNKEFLTEEIDDDTLLTEREKIKNKIDRFGEVNLMAISEYNELKERYEFLRKQEDDLTDSLNSLTTTIKKIDKTSREQFLKTFDEINKKLKDVFPRLVPGGSAKLTLTDLHDPLESGIDVMAQPPGKKLSSITLLSGGEKALAAIALIFAIFMIKPTPFCLMDEVDAPLDDINIERFIDLLKELSTESQFILISHNKKTMEMADTLYGITMEDPGVSKMVSIRLTDRGA